MLEIRQALQLNKNHDDTWKFFIRLGNITGNCIPDRNYQGINGAWKNKPCYVVGAGPDLKDFIERIGWSFLDDKNTIGINHLIEDYDRFKWFLFLDKRFLLKTTYNMGNFTGHIFAHCNTGFPIDERVTIFHTGTNKVTEKIEDGLYNGNLSGLCALNLALISGANPIYMIGFGNTKEATKDNYHYKYNYTAERKEDKVFNKFKNVMNKFKIFEPFSNRIVHVTNGAVLPGINKRINFTDFILNNRIKKIEQIEIKGRIPKIVHISFSNNLDVHADITRHIINECYGKHQLVSQKEDIPNDADLYITEHFLSTAQFVNNFTQKHKTINIVHTAGCVPQKGFLKNIALTNAWKKWLEYYYVENIKVIYGGIDINQYRIVTPNYESRKFGRITRWSAAKIHPEWNKTVKEILDEDQDAKCIFFTQLDQENKREILKHARMIYNKDCQINMFKGNFLKDLSIYVHVNGSFKETLSFAIIEAMACGLPIVFLSEGTGVIEEVTGDSQLKCENINDIKKTIKKLLIDIEMKKEFGLKAREQSKKFDKKIMVNKFNEVIIECLKK
jgi:glycosyltransferase involved in cell wall biosynthesis